MEKLDEIKARYTELVYQSVMSADTVTSEINDAIRLLPRLENICWKQRYIQLEECYDDYRKDDIPRQEEVRKLKQKTAWVMKHYVWERPTTLGECIKAWLFGSKEVQHDGLGESADEAK